MDLWLAVVVICMGAQCVLIPDEQLSQDEETCIERVMDLGEVAVQAAPSAITIGGCVRLPLKVS